MILRSVWLVNRANLKLTNIGAYSQSVPVTQQPLSPVACCLWPNYNCCVMDGQRQQVFGLAIVALLILLFVLLRHLWSRA